MIEDRQAGSLDRRKCQLTLLCALVDYLIFSQNYFEIKLFSKKVPRSKCGSQSGSSNNYHKKCCYSVHWSPMSLVKVLTMTRIEWASVPSYPVWLRCIGWEMYCVECAILFFYIKKFHQKVNIFCIHSIQPKSE